MMKRFISLILAFALCAIFSVPAFAADVSLSADVMESKIAADLQSKQERMLMRFPVGGLSLVYFQT